MISQDGLKYACLASCDYMDGTSDHRLAGVVFEVGMECYPKEPVPVMASWPGDIRKVRKREERALRAELKEKTMAVIRSDPQRYGFAGFLGMLLLAIQIIDVVKRVAEWFMDVRYGDNAHYSDTTIQSVR